MTTIKFKRLNIEAYKPGKSSTGKPANSRWDGRRRSVCRIGRRDNEQWTVKQPCIQCVDKRGKNRATDTQSAPFTAPAKLSLQRCRPSH